MTKNRRRGILIGMKAYLASTVHLLFATYTLLIFIRIVLSWIPSWYSYKPVQFVAFCTDPYLQLFRRIIPPLGGILDLSPLLAFFVLRLSEIFLLSLLR